MRTIKLELEGVAVVARLLDEKAPKTCQALWDILPFEDMVTHARWSGGRLHTNNHPKLNIDASRYPFIENPSAFQAPGDVVVWPLINEIAVSYAPGRFAWMGQQWIVTKIASIGGDMSQFARKIDRLQWDGAKKLVIRRGDESKEVSPPVVGQGAKVAIEFEGKRLVIELFDDRAPKLCKAILNALPLEGPVTNMHTSGELFHYWVNIPEIPDEAETKRERWPVDYEGKQIGNSAVAFYDPREMRGNNPGDILFCADEGLLIVHGQGSFGPGLLGQGTGRVGQAVTQKVGRIIEGDLDDLQELARRVEWEGAKTIRMIRAQ